ncbi:MAG: TIGR01244 family sulfur transferase [Hyphomicrobiales bacterium]
MAKFKHIDDTLSVSAQLTESDISNAADEGFMTIINLRPDGENADAMTDETARSIAHSCGLQHAHIPINPKVITDDVADTLGKAFVRAKQPVLAYCGTGKRATLLWATTLAGSKNPQDVLALAVNAGFDLVELMPRIEQRALSHTENSAYLFW